ncbi:MAG TPA: hypothetical protein PKU91_02050, partial [Phycisphaerales bacterium]|nr:hypothetical protein [Phycisphaerales bacterium]
MRMRWSKNNLPKDLWRDRNRARTAGRTKETTSRAFPGLDPPIHGQTNGQTIGQTIGQTRVRRPSTPTTEPAAHATGTHLSRDRAPGEGTLYTKSDSGQFRPRP